MIIPEDDRRTRLQRIYSWLMMTKRRQATYTLHELCELADEYEQMMHEHQNTVNKQLLKLLEDYQNCTVTPPVLVPETEEPKGATMGKCVGCGKRTPFMCLHCKNSRKITVWMCEMKECRWKHEEVIFAGLDWGVDHGGKPKAQQG